MSLDIDSPTAGVEPAPSAAPFTGRRRRHFTQLSISDRVVLGVMVGVPAFLHIVLVWIPAILTGVLSFTEWDNLEPISAIQFVGFRNYWQIFTIFDTKLFPALFNNFVLMVWLTICSAVGILFAYLLDKNVQGHSLLPEHLLLPGRAVGGGRRLHLEERDVQS